MRLVEQAWNFARCYDGEIGGPMVAWTMATFCLLAFASAAFFAKEPRGLFRRSRPASLAILLGVLAVHAFVLFYTWNRVWSLLHVLSLHMSPGDFSSEEFLLWQGVVMFGVLSSALLLGTLILLARSPRPGEIPAATACPDLRHN